MRNLKPKAVLILFFLFLFFKVGFATTYYVSQADGNDDYNGLYPTYISGINGPWLTLGRAGWSDIVAGDTVYVRTGTYTTLGGASAVLNVENSGTSGSRITYQNYNGETVYVSGQYAGIRIPGDYVTIDGFIIDGALTEPNVIDVHIPVLGDYVIIKNCQLKNMKLTSESQHAIWFRDHNIYCQVLNCYFENIGEYMPPGGDDWGDGIRIEHSDAHHNLIQGCTFDRTGENASCGHLAIDMWGHHNIFRNNICNHTGFGSAGNLVADSYNIFEDNIAYDNSYNQETGFPYEATGTAGRTTIWRRNKIYLAHGTGLHVWGDTNRDASYSHIYNNVFYDLGNDNEEGWRKGVTFQKLSGATLLGIVFKNNIFRSNVEDGIEYKNTVEEDHFVSDNHLQSMGDPLFVNEGIYDFHLQSGSPCFNAGGWLTYTNGTGNASTTLIVDDSLYFSDGFGLVVGDYIQLEGQTITSKVTNVDYSTHTLTLETALTWGDGVGVALPYFSSAPDMGVYELEVSYIYGAGELLGLGILTPAGMNYSYASSSVLGLGIITSSAKSYLDGSSSLLGLGILNSSAKSYLKGDASLLGIGIMESLAEKDILDLKIIKPIIRPIIIKIIRKIIK